MAPGVYLVFWCGEDPPEWERCPIGVDSAWSTYEAALERATDLGKPYAVAHYSLNQTGPGIPEAFREVP